MIAELLLLFIPYESLFISSIEDGLWVVDVHDGTGTIFLKGAT